MADFFSLSRPDALAHLEKTFADYRATEGSIRPAWRQQLASALGSAVQGFEIGFSALTLDERDRLIEAGGPDVLAAVMPQRPPPTPNSGVLVLDGRLSERTGNRVWDVAGLRRTSKGEYVFPRPPELGESFYDSATQVSIASIGRMSDGRILGATDSRFYQANGVECLWLA